MTLFTKCIQFFDIINNALPNLRLQRLEKIQLDGQDKHRIMKQLLKCEWVLIHNSVHKHSNAGIVGYRIKGRFVKQLLSSGADFYLVAIDDEKYLIPANYIVRYMSRYMAMKYKGLACESHERGCTYYDSKEKLLKHLQQ